MEFGVCLPHRWIYASASAISQVASEAENVGYDSVWVTDHIVVPIHHTERGHIFYEGLITLAYAAAITERVKLGTCVLVVPLRNPILVAKQVATIDALSGGRVILGVGTGWIEEELRCLGASWEERGAMLDEAIDVMRLLWRQEGPLSFHGKYVRFSDVLFYPKPAKKGGPPIWIGGKREPSLRRAAERGDGWIPWAVSPRELEEGSRRIRTLSGGRDIEVACLIPVDIGGKRTGYLGTLGERHHILAGSLDKISSTIEDFSEAGLDHLICSFRDIRLFKDEKIDEINNQMRIFAREIIPSFK